MTEQTVHTKIRTIALVSLSKGLLGEDFMQHVRDLGLERLQRYGVAVKVMPNAQKGIDYLQRHPEKRAEDLLRAFVDPEVDMILCAIGGDDTYRLLPHLFSNDQLRNAVCDKIFLGFSDTTINHLMLHKVGLPTYYGQAFLPDVCELSSQMLPYTRRCFEQLLYNGRIDKVTPSAYWYESRTDFGPDQLGVVCPRHRNRGFELWQGPAVFSGPILGGCLDSLYDLFDGERYADMPDLCRRYHLFPDQDEWQGKILLLETSEEKMPPAKFAKAVAYLKGAGVFEAVSGVLVGKPMDEAYCQEYRACLLQGVGDPDLPVVGNLNIGHATPRCIIPFGIPATVDAAAQQITFCYDDIRRQ